jgi:hypothetical protein
VALRPEIERKADAVLRWKARCRLQERVWQGSRYPELGVGGVRPDASRCQIGVMPEGEPLRARERQAFLSRRWIRCGRGEKQDGRWKSFSANVANHIGKRKTPTELFQTFREKDSVKIESAQKTLPERFR